MEKYLIQRDGIKKKLVPLSAGEFFLYADTINIADYENFKKINNYVEISDLSFKDLYGARIELLDGEAVLESTFLLKRTCES